MVRVRVVLIGVVTRSRVVLVCTMVGMRVVVLREAPRRRSDLDEQ
jgi:hypothetical protein